MNGTITGTMLKFLDTDGLPPYYQVKAYIVLSAADEDEPDQNLLATRSAFREAEKALKVAKETYVHDAKDAGKLEELEQTIKEEWAALHQREEDFSD